MVGWVKFKVKGKAGDGHRMARGHDWKYVLSDVDQEYYFDEQSDPGEQRNLFENQDSESSVVLRKLQQALSDWMVEIGDRK